MILGTLSVAGCSTDSQSTRQLDTPPTAAPTCTTVAVHRTLSHRPLTRAELRPTHRTAPRSPWAPGTGLCQHIGEALLSDDPVTSVTPLPWQSVLALQREMQQRCVERDLGVAWQTYTRRLSLM